MTTRISTPFDGLPGFSRFYVDHAAGRLPASLHGLRLPHSPDAWREMRELRPAFRPQPQLLAALRREHERLDAPAASLESLRLLESGQALVVITGQQPGLFGGPLYSLYKVATAVALAARLTEDHGRPVVPVFWNAADDADFDEAAQGMVTRDELATASLAIPRKWYTARSWVGDLPAEAVAEAVAPAGHTIDLADTGGEQLDFGRQMTRLWLRRFGAAGLVVVDARMPEIRTAAAPVFRRYLEVMPDVHGTVVAAAGALEREGYAAVLAPEASEACLFVTRDRKRERLSPAELPAALPPLVRDHPEALSPNVVLRPLVADCVLPTVASVLGPGELAYFTQIAPIYPLFDMVAPIVVDRLSATLAPPEVFEIAATLDLLPRDLLAAPQDAVQRYHARQIPADFVNALATSRARLTQAIDELREPARAYDASLGQMIDSALEKILFQQERLEEGAFKKAKQRKELQRPRFRHLADFLLPRSKPQERMLSTLTWDRHVTTLDLLDLAREHVAALLTGRRQHYLVGIE